MLGASPFFCLIAPHPSSLAFTLAFQLDTLVCGTKDDAWTVEELRSAIKVDHGYTIESQPVVDLIETLSAFEKDDRRLFCMFITGSPNLPVGGMLSGRAGGGRAGGGRTFYVFPAASFFPAPSVFCAALLFACRSVCDVTPVSASLCL